MSARNIRSERIRKGLSIEEAAKELGVSKNTLISWELNNRSPDGAFLVKMVKMFGCTADWLLGLTEERK